MDRWTVEWLGLGGVRKHPGEEEGSCYGRA